MKKITDKDVEALKAGKKITKGFIHMQLDDILEHDKGWNPGAMISLAIELLTSNIRHSYGEINFERYPRPVEVEGEDKH